MIIAHKIALAPNNAQATYFARWVADRRHPLRQVEQHQPTAIGAAMSTNSQVVTSLYLWSDGHSSVYGPGESAEVSAPGWLFNSEDTDPDTHRELLANFKDKIIEAFALIWGEKTHAAYDFELAAQNACGEAE